MTLQWIFNKGRKLKERTVCIAVAVTSILLVLLLGIPRTGVAFPCRDIAVLLFQAAVFSRSPGPFLSQVRLAKGKFLVASRQLTDPNFGKTVVLLLEYDKKGAMGVVINRPTKVKLSRVFPDMQGLQERTDTVYRGGPVSANQLLLLVRSGSEPEKSRRVFEDIYLTSSRKVLKRIIAGAIGGEKFRIFAGYAGWSSGQLDMEVSKGGWHILRADSETVFDKKPSEIWPELIRRSSAQWVRLRQRGEGL